MNLDEFRDSMRTCAWESDKTKETDDPISMIIIMSRTKTDNDAIFETEQDCVKTSGAAMLTLFSHMDEMTDKQHDLLTQWVHGRIRKIVKHANPGKFNNLDRIPWPHERMKINDTECIVFSPLPYSMQCEQWFKSVHKLQVSGYQANHAIMNTVEPFTLLITINDLHMTTGKMIAQAMHAVQVAVERLNDTDYDNWCTHGNMIAFQYGEPDGNAPITIIDAGLTEIPAGSFTASAMLI